MCHKIIKFIAAAEISLILVHLQLQGICEEKKVKIPKPTLLAQSQDAQHVNLLVLTDLS